MAVLPIGRRRPAEPLLLWKPVEPEEPKLRLTCSLPLPDAGVAFNIELGKLDGVKHAPSDNEVSFLTGIW